MRTIQIIKEFDPNADYGVHIPDQISQCLSVLRKGEEFIINDFINKHLNEFTTKKTSKATNQRLVYKAVGIGEKIGLIKEAESKGLTLDEFVKLESVEYFLEHYSKTRYKNISPDKHGFGGTQRTYSYALKNFNNWLIGKPLEYQRLVPTGNDNYKKITESAILKGLEDLLRLFKDSQGNDSHFIKIIKKYLLDSCHDGKSSATMNSIYHAIISYFEKNEAPIHFRFNSKIKYNNQTELESEQNLSLEDFMKILTVGRPSLVQKAVFLCKFHRGLDSSTLADRFNFESWPQLVEYFGTEKYHRWDLEKCPVPIKLVRIKTSFQHVGFLDRDAIIAIQDYLKFREKKTGENMQDGQALFLNTFSKPITEKWIRKTFFDLTIRSGVQKKIESDHGVRYEKDSHELRDLLKSTLLACGARYDVSDHVIGHKPKDSYEKQAKLYSENLRSEFSKVSRKINIFSNMSTYMKGDENTQLLHEEIKQLKETLIETKESSENQLQNEIEDYKRTKENVLKILQYLKL
ncbi:MAG: hypothetical protein IIC67_01285 [Thaumarchaeota archaeon]|nr:hypothetical protein [Nitrososphaerota archaeon]